MVFSCGGSLAHAQGFPRDLLPPSGVKEVGTLEQNWSDDDARWFYKVPQGSKLRPYQWFFSLEQPDSTALFRDPAHFETLGYLPRSPDQQGNPDGLPIGFVKDGDQLGLTCAACHTGLLRLGTKAWLIDGAPTSGDFERLLRRLVQALTQTTTDAERGKRFAARVLGTGAGPDAQAALLQQLKDVVSFRAGYNQRNLPSTTATPFGPGRVDAFGAIMNEVAATFAQVPTNAAAADAPVSYPFLWDTPQHDRVQWNGSAPNTTSFLLAPILKTIHVGALGRNVGEVLGVFGTLDATDAGLTGLKGYPASARRQNLIDIEEKLRALWSPQWPAEFGAIDENDRMQGAALFKTHCVRCHDDQFERKSPLRHIEAKMSVVGTDSKMASNFATRRASTGLLQGRLVALPGFRRFQAENAVSDLLIHMVQRAILGPDPQSVAPLVLAAMAPDFTVYAELQLDDQRHLVGAFNQIDLDLQGKVRQVRTRQGLLLKQAGKILLPDDSAANLGRFLDLAGRESPFDLANRLNTSVRAAVTGTQVTFDTPVPVQYAYKARPLNGVWATAPYLHNGSVPTLDELLKPAAKRLRTFKLGTREFDPVRVGFKSEGAFEFDTTLVGNSNSGHEYERELTDDERRQLIAYIKSL
jgi:mono/diheme cytochrome c family protein